VWPGSVLAARSLMAELREAAESNIVRPELCRPLTVFMSFLIAVIAWPLPRFPGRTTSYGKGQLGAILSEFTSSSAIRQAKDMSQL